MKNVINRDKAIGNAVVIGMFICHCQVAQAGWTGVMNGIAFGWDFVSVTSSIGVAGSRSSPNVFGPSAAMAPAPGYTYTAALPSGSSVNTVARVKGMPGYIWQADTSACNGDSADNTDLKNFVTPVSSDATTMLDVLGFTSAPCGSGGVSYTFTWHWSGSDIGTTQRISFYEFDGDPSVLPNNLPGFLGTPGVEPLSGPIVPIYNPFGCGEGGFCPPGFDEVRTFSTPCTTADPSKIYMVTEGIAVSLPGCVTGFFNGFLPPIGGADATGGNCGAPIGTFRLGRTIPVKMELDCGGSPITTGNHRLWLSQCGTGAFIPATSTDAATTGNLFRKTGDGWHFNLSTAGLSAGTWELVAILYDGTPHSSMHTVFVELR